MTRWVWGDASQWAPPAEKNPSNIVHVLGVPRSGSTLLRVMLDGHSQLFSPPELMLLLFHRMGERRRLTEQYGYDWARRGLLQALSGLLEDEAAAQREIDAWEAADAEISDVFKRLQSLCAPSLLVNKTPSDIARLANLEYADAMFDGARYLHLVRHPCAVIESFVRMDLQGLMGQHFGIWDDDPHRMGAEVWAQWNENAMALGERVGDRYTRVNYESIVREPASEMRKICEFLRVPFEDAVLRPYDGDRATVDASGQATLGDWNLSQHKAIDPAEADKWRGAGSIDLSEHARAVAARLGYTV